MKLLAPKYPPLRFENLGSWSDEFKVQLKKSNSVKVVTGYISEASILALKDLLANASNELPRLKSFELVVGMAYFDGLTERQKVALGDVQSILQESRLGSIYIPFFMKIHSKCTIFSQDQKEVVLVGSTNFSALIDQRQSELDMLIDTPIAQTSQVQIYVQRVIENCSALDKKVLDSIPTLKSSNSRLISTSGVFSVIPGQAPELVRNPEISFHLPLKTELKSNLNKFNAAPRGKIPRSWWEIELIVPTSIQSATHFPSHVNNTDEFYVFTDDGYSFKCHVSGGTKPHNNKNFESSGDLEILGLWLKGRLVESGCLDEGDFVTQSSLECYGRSEITMQKLDSVNCWFLDFSRKV